MPSCPLRIVTYAIRRPSGDQTGAMTNSVLALVVSRVFAPLEASRTNRSALSFARSWMMTATRDRSGDKMVSP